MYEVVLFYTVVMHVFLFDEFTVISENVHREKPVDNSEFLYVVTYIACII